MDSTTKINIDAVRFQIAYKLNYNSPYYATSQSSGAVLTDMDVFPYKRFFRGVYYDDKPHIMEREAGWRVRQDGCYVYNREPKICKTHYCWEYPCSTCNRCQATEKKKEDKAVANYTISP